MGKPIWHRVVGWGALIIGAFSVLSWIARAAGVTVGLSKVPEAMPIWQRALAIFLSTPLLQLVMAGVLAIGWLGMLYVPRLLALHKLEQSDSLHRWSVTIDVEPNHTSILTNTGGYLLFDVTLTNISSQFQRVLEFRWITKNDEGERVVVSTENSRDQPYRTALSKLDRMPGDRLFPLKNPIELPPNSHVEGRIEIDVPPHLAQVWMDFDKQVALMDKGHFEIFDRTSGQVISLSMGQGWDALKNEKRPVNRLTTYSIRL